MSKMPAQQLLLNWKDHNGSLVSVFENLLKKNTLVDCTLAAEGQYLKAHKLVLSACSSYFELLFSQESEKNPIVILKDVTFQDLEAAVNFMYKGEVEVCVERLATFLEVADTLKIKGLGSDVKSQDSNEKVSSTESSSEQLVLTKRQQSRKENSNLRIHNPIQSSNVSADCELIRKDESSAVYQSSQKRSSHVNNVATLNMGSCHTLRQETSRDSDSLENIQQSLALPSFTSDERPQTEDNPIIKTEPETVTFVEDQLHETERDLEDDVTKMDDEDEWDEHNIESNDVVLTSQQDVDYPSEHMKTEDSTSVNVEVMQPGNWSSSEGCTWIKLDDQQNVSSEFVKEETRTSESWNQEAVAHAWRRGVTANGDGIGPIAETSAPPVGSDWIQLDDQQKLSSEYAKEETGTSEPWSGNAVAHGVSASGDETNPIPGTSTVSAVQSTGETLQPVLLRPPSKKLFCPSCKEVFVQMVDLMRHVRSECGVTVPTLSGDESQPNAPALPQPLKLQKPEQKSVKRSSFKCSKCNYVTPSRLRLKRHLHIHIKRERFKCQHCDYVSESKGALATHIRTHSGKKPFKCTHCDYASAIKRNLVLHIRNHTKPFKCQHCDFASGRKVSLVGHVRKHTGKKPFKCTHCDYASAIKSNLARHIRNHTKPFKCQHCDFASGMKVSYVAHVLTHTGKKPFKCTHCDYASTTKRNLARHILNHTKPFKCEHCEFVTGSKGRLVAHVRTHMGAETL